MAEEIEIETEDAFKKSRRGKAYQDLVDANAELIKENSKISEEARKLAKENKKILKQILEKLEK